MTIDELMKLVNAGFTKEEILTITGTPTPTEEVTQTTVEEDVAPSIVENKAEEIKKTEVTPKPTPQTTNVNFAPMMTDAQIEKLAQMLNRGNASIDMPTPRDTDKVLSEHFSNLMNGKE